MPPILGGMSVRRGVLQLVTPAPFEEEQSVEQVPSSESGHSLHGLIAKLEGVPVPVSRYFISRYSKRGDVVLDPFCGLGESCLEASLLGRIPVGASVDSVALKIAGGKLSPADLGEVALRLQLMNLKKPVDISQYNVDFREFFNAETFCELFNLRTELRRNSGRVERFIEAIVLAILHGHTAGYLSAYTSPIEGLSPEAQIRMNRKRGQGPDYRAIGPRILKRAAWALRDALPQVLSEKSSAKLIQSNGRDLSGVRSSSVDMILSKLPSPSKEPRYAQSWLRRWFAGEGAAAAGLFDKVFSSVEDWSMLINEVFTEWARVLKPGCRAVLMMPGSAGYPSKAPPHELLNDLVNNDLKKFWQFEGVIRHQAEVSGRKNCLKPLASSADISGEISVVLRRR